MEQNKMKRCRAHLAATKEQRNKGRSPFTCKAPGAHPGGAPNAN
jgi:hypothetical protein